jgi:nucleotide-binding universal stress UspA family protein
MRVDNILCPVDFSELSGLGLRYAAALARRQGARLTVLYAHSFQPPPYFSVNELEALHQRLRDSLGEARAALERFIAEHGAGPAEATVAEGPPADVIRRVAEGAGAGLIVMGTHGRSGVNRLMLGSVAERVLRESRIPVLTVRGGAAAPPDGPKRILCPVNNTPAAREALNAALWLASSFGGELTVVHVPETRPERAIEDICAWVPEAARARCHLREAEAGADADHAILTMAREEGSDLLVVGSQHRRFFDSTVLGSTTARLVRHAPCPVLTVPAAPEAG